MSLMSASHPIQLLLAPHNGGTPRIVAFPYELAGKENEQPEETYERGDRLHAGNYSLLPLALDQNQASVCDSQHLAASLPDSGFTDKLTPPHGRRD